METQERWWNGAKGQEASHKEDAAPDSRGTYVLQRIAARLQVESKTRVETGHGQLRLRNEKPSSIDDLLVAIAMLATEQKLVKGLEK